MSDIEELVQKYTKLNEMEISINEMLAKKEGVLPQGVVREISEKSIAHNLKFFSPDNVWKVESSRH